MIDICLSFTWFFGFVYASNRWLKINLAYAPVFSISLIGILLFAFAVSNFLKPGTWFIIYTGIGLSAASGIHAWYNRKADDSKWLALFFLVLFLLFVLSFLLSIGMSFTVDDDYVYWGIIGKYLFLNHHLPDQETTIISRHLSYTPGTSVIHYLFYSLSGKYESDISYFAQNIILSSTLCVVLKKENIKRSIILLCLFIFCLTLFCGSVFTKLQVDYLLSAYFFAVLWIYFKEKSELSTIITICGPICFLFLIKEIGIVLGLFLIFIILIDLLFNTNLSKGTKIKSIIGIISTGCILILIKQVWTGHCAAMGFLKFNSAINMESVQHSFQIFSDKDIRAGFLIFIKDIIIGPADRLNLPYLFWYLMIVFLWFKMFKKKSHEFKTRYLRLLTILSLMFIIYLLSIYFLQIIIFQVGRSFHQTIGLTRYVNIFFAQVVFFTILLYIDSSYFQKKLTSKVMYSFVITVILVLGLSRVETTLHREDHYYEAEQIAKKVALHIPEGENRICIVPGTNDYHLWIKFLYYLLPNQISRAGFPVQNKDKFYTSLGQYDFVFFNNPKSNIVEWINPIVDKTFEHSGFFRIESKDNQNIHNSTIRLKKIF